MRGVIEVSLAIILFNKRYVSRAVVYFIFIESRPTLFD